MRKKIVAGNWKMNTLLQDGENLAKDIVKASEAVRDDVTLIIAPPFTHLHSVGMILEGSRILLSAQNCADMDKGAYTGEVSAGMLASAGCSHVILGHSERREYYGENSGDVIILGVATPNVGKEGSSEEIAAFLEENGYTYPTLMDEGGAIAGGSYYISAFPTTFMIDKNGNIFGYATGQLTRDIMENIIQQTIDGERAS